MKEVSKYSFETPPHSSVSAVLVAMFTRVMSVPVMMSAPFAVRAPDEPLRVASVARVEAEPPASSAPLSLQQQLFSNLETLFFQT